MELAVSVSLPDWTNWGVLSCIVKLDWTEPELEMKNSLGMQSSQASTPADSVCRDMRTVGKSIAEPESRSLLLEMRAV